MFREITESEYKNEIENKDQSTYILVFHALWCPPCRMFKNSLEQIAQNDNVNVYRVNVDDNKTLSREFQVMSIPTWFVYKNGKKVFNGAGYMPYEELKEVVEKNN
ncbi:thioredoxin family protein [Mycoplasmopsis felifaucium]|uniref:thioredoxin family protein n=1 Tax=Mycoplasmopsis felifaucium TaxID=35768 RepID=UPI00047FB586|nr:thioredoxin family protein [Mycoplasmopsis felifaucium]